MSEAVVSRAVASRVRLNAEDRAERDSPALPILLADSEAHLLHVLAEQLRRDGYAVSPASTTQHARVLARGCHPQAAIIGELGSPRGALDLLAEIRHGVGWDERLPVIVLGSPGRRLDLLRAYETGADDFIARPPTYIELRARLRALLRRAAAAQGQATLRVGPLLVEPSARAVLLRDRTVVLSRLEYELLLYLAREPERVFAKSELLRAIWGLQAPGPTRTLDSHASRLRRKLAEADSSPAPRWLVSVRGVGYRLR
jgi:DNA-binding response OmpR family regulator